MEKDASNSNSVPSKPRRWFLFFLFVVLALICWVKSVEQSANYSNWGQWLFPIGIVIFAIMALISLIALSNDWTVMQEERAIGKAVGWAFAIPIILAAVGFVIWGLIAAYNWFGTIPSWAGVIIVLLIAILLHLRTRR